MGLSPLSLERVLRDEPGWYTGDFHCHTHFSDGVLTPSELLDVARAEGLDFFTITDHNTIGAYAGFGAPDDLLVIPGIEITFDSGHFNVFGVETIPDWMEPFRAGPIEFDLAETQMRLAALVEQAAASGLLASINHPLLPPWVWADPETDLAHVHCVEIWNDPSWSDNRVANPAAVELWTHWLNAGHRITAVGGSDYHRPQPKPGPARPPERLGAPRTVVYAQALSGQAILDGLRRRQVYMTMGPSVTFSGQWHESVVEMGQDLGAVAGALDLAATVSEGYEGRASIIRNGIPVAEVPLIGEAANVRYTAQLDPKEPAWFRLDVRARAHQVRPEAQAVTQRANAQENNAQSDHNGLAWAVTNPIFTGPAHPPTQVRYGDFVETPVIHKPADRLQWPKLKKIAQGS